MGFIGQTEHHKERHANVMWKSHLSQGAEKIDGHVGFLDGGIFSDLLFKDTGDNILEPFLEWYVRLS
jgi:hypothetical protein